jgi:signal transduction histidine kinase
MRSLFLKIFLWFWLALALVVGVMFLTTISLRQDTLPARLSQVTGGVLAMTAQSAAQTYDLHGPAQLDGYLEHVKQATHVRAYLFDLQGHSLGRQPAPRAAALFARRIGLRHKSDLQVTLLALRGGQPAFGPHGREYVLVAEIPTGVVATPLLRFLAIFIAASIICWWLARNVASPIVALRAATRRIAAGEFSTRVGPTMGRRRDEIAALGHDFDTMAARLETLMRAQHRLLGDISHELRSPLARLSVAAGLARRSANPETIPAIDRIELEVDRLNALIGQLTALSKLESGTEALDRASIDLPALVKEVAADCDFEARNRGRSVVVLPVDKDAARVRVTGYPDLLHRAVENVVRNAVRYTKEGSAVEVGLRRDGEHAVITIRDYGPGLPESQLTEIFRPFYRVDDARDRQTGGVGLGLAITERAVRLHGGTVSAEKAEGEGLVVRIRVPIS